MRVIVTGTLRNYSLSIIARMYSTRIFSGASGLLGSAVYAAFKSSPDNHDVLGLAYSRSSGELQKLDLLDTAATEHVFNEFKPDCKF